MFKIAGSIIDCYDDPDFIEHPNTAALIGSEIKDFGELEDLGDKDFAVKILSKTGEHRRFPIYNELITGVSCHYLEESKNSLPEEVVKAAGFYLGKACDKYGIDKTATVEECTESRPFRVSLVDEPVEELLLSKEATQMLFWKGIKEQFPDMTPADRVASVTEICKAAGAESIEDQALWDYVPKDTYGPNFHQGIKDRIAMAPDEENRSMWKEAEKKILDMHPIEGADTLATFDKVAGYTERYKDGFYDPYWACFSGFPIVKEAKRQTQHNLKEQYGSKEEGTPQEYRKMLNVKFPLFDMSFDKHAEAIQYADMADWPEEYVAEVQNHFKLDKEASVKNAITGGIGGALTGGSIGSFGGVPGAITGATIGGAAGIVSGAMKKKTPKKINHA
jgi:hypothetical protein